MATHLEQVMTQSLECPICFNLFNEPKQLGCSHTFCKDCLVSLYESQPGNNQLSCPVCRKITLVEDGDVSTLQTIVPIKSLVEDVKNAHQPGRQICTFCDSDDKPSAETYCQECEDYMCVSCHQAHAKRKKNSSHEIISMTDIISGKSSVKKPRKCKKHSSEQEEFVCIDCNEYVCFRCRMLDHDKVGHRVIDAKEHENNHRKNIECLQQKAETKKTVINKHIDIVEKQRSQLKTVLKQRTKKIDQAYEESVYQLNKRRDMLINEYKEHIQVLDSKLGSMKDADHKQLTSISSASKLVGNGTKAPLEGQVLTIHNTLYNELKEILGKDEPDCSLPRNITSCAEGLEFKRNNDVLELGTNEKTCWELRIYISLPAKDSMNAMAWMPDGRMAVGYRTGGVQSFSVDGPQETVLRSVGILDVSFLSDGRCVVRDHNNNISLYAPQCEKLDVQFDTLSDDEGGWGGLDVDKEDYIYTSYRKVKKIHVFEPTGGKAVREITCDGYEPVQIFAMKSNKMVVVSSGFSVKVLEESGKQKYDVIKDGVCAYPAVCQDDTVLIAWVKDGDGLVTIEKYSHELKYTKTLVTDHKIQTPERIWYYLQEFLSGEIAFCTPDRLYRFNKSATLADVIGLRTDS